MGNPIFLPGNRALPFKYHADHRHRLPKARYRVTNWPEYDASLRQRGSLTAWFTDEAIKAWRAEPRTTPGGQPYNSSLAISTALTMRLVFGLALRQTKGADRLRHRTAWPRPRRAGPLYAKSAGEDAGGAPARASGNRPAPFAGGQHRAEARRSRRMAG
jgi:hypothetical protein